jgi:hypothetical protein
MSSWLRISPLTLFDLRLTELDANFTAWRVKQQNECNAKSRGAG